MNPISQCGGPRIARRDLLRAGAAAAVGVSLPQLLRADATRNSRAKADHCIVIFLNGGPSHLDMWDPKPDAPAEIRGEFGTTATSVPGVRFGEHIPKMAKWMDRTAVIRSAFHSVNNAHAAGVYTALTGHDRGDNSASTFTPNDYPSIGSTMSHLRPPTTPVVPYVSLPYITKEGAGGPPQPGFYGGWLGKSLDPLFILKDPNDPAFAMPELSLGADVDPTRLAARKDLMAALSAGGRPGASLSDLDTFQMKAFDLLTSAKMRDAVRIDQEPAKTRDAYGRNIYGQSVLLCRRMIEAGTRVACLSWAPDANATWDTHGGNFSKLKTQLLPQLDGAIGALLEDLSNRSMLDRTLVVVMGEFGRSPKVNAQAGRDHWNFCYSLMLAGGGIKGGAVHGASDKIGGKPSRNPVTPADVIATIYSCLGINHDAELRDKLDRPLVLVPWGRPITEIMN